MLNTAAEQTNLLMIYMGDTRKESIINIQEMQKSIADEEKDLKLASDHVLAVLSGMSDLEFKNMELDIYGGLA